MTDLTRRPQVVHAHVVAAADVIPLGADRWTVTGTIAQVRAALEALTVAGQLVHASDLVPTGVPGRVLTTVKLLPPVQRSPRPARRRLRPGAIATLAAGGAVVLGAGVWAAVELVDELLAHIWVVIVATALLGLLAAKGGRRCCQIIVTVTHRHR